MDALKWLLVPAVSLTLATAQARDGEKAQWSFDVLIGDAYNFDSRTQIDHTATGTISIDGDYETRGFEGPLHYAWRVARWQDDRAWELQLLHHKLYLKNVPDGIEALSVSHGFNIITVNRAFAIDGWRMRIGLGPVVTHAEARIGASSYDGPYELSGVAALVGAGKTFDLSSHWHVIAELSATYGHVAINPSGSPELELELRNPALHAQLGVGYRF